MKAGKLYLFKVPFDNSYRDVYDFPNNLTSDVIFARISALAFPSITIDYPAVRSFKSTNNKTSISVSYPYNQIKNYNYLVVEVEEDVTYEFYFITGFDSLNESDIKPSTNILIEWDCWLNNIGSIYQSNRKQSYQYGHIKDSIYFNDSKIYPNPIYGAAAELDLIESAADVTTTRYKVLWMRIWVDVPDMYIKRNNEYAYIYNTGCYFTHSRSPILFVPYLVVDTYTMTKVYGYTWDGKEVDGTVSVYSSDHILKLDLTYYPPFTYRIETDKSITILFGPGGTIMKVGEVYYKTADTYNSIGQYFEKIFDFTNIKLPNPISLIYAIDNSSGISAKLTIAETYNIFNPTYADYNENAYLTNFDHSSIRYLYPYYYHSILCNSGSTPIIFYKNSISCRITVYSETISPYYVLTFYDADGLQVHRSKPVFIQNTGSILYANSAYDAYLRNNGNQLQVQYDQIQVSTIKNAASLITSSMRGVSNSGYSSTIIRGLQSGTNIALDYYMSKKALDAKIADIRNAQGTFNMPAIDANANIMQDLLLLRSFSPANATDFEAIATNEQYYGKQLNFVQALNSSNKLMFDYRQTVNACLPEVTNIDERRTLESALNRGIRFWHYDIYTGNQLDALKTMNPQINNPDRR